MKESTIKPTTGFFLMVEAIQNNKCMRCLSLIKPESRNDQLIPYCQACEGFGRVTMGMKLYRFERLLSKKEHCLSMPFALSIEQTQASNALSKAIDQNQECYLYAVCGAGKTEMLYQSMVIALQKGWRIALVIPRTNIVKELGERLKPIFPKTVIKCLHQNEKDDEDADLLILTPQQLLRYHHEFDLIYFDEADAFPYKGNPFLSQLVKKALKEEGKMVQMSATLPKKQQQDIARMHQPLFVLPARFHRHKLDQFQVSYCLNMSQWPKNQTVIPKVLSDWLDIHQKQHRQALLFVPTIAWGVWLFEAMKQQGYPVSSVSSVDEHRDNKISWFRDKLGLFLVTTTLLERGVTFSDIDVAIINGSHAIYDEFTLVQMAGRVGRKPDYPTGEIMIFTERMTTAIQNAEKYIQKMNSEASKRRLLDDDLPNLR